MFQPISYSSDRGGISQVTDKGETTASFLLVQNTRLEDSGTYMCSSSVGTNAEVSVHVIESSFLQIHKLGIDSIYKFQVRSLSFWLLANQNQWVEGKSIRQPLKFYFWWFYWWMWFHEIVSTMFVSNLKMKKREETSLCLGKKSL